MGDVEQIAEVTQARGGPPAGGVRGSVRKWGLEEQIKPNDPETWRLVFGDIDDRLSQEITIRLASAFFRHFLCGLPAPILNDPPRFYPNIEDRTPA